MAWKLVSRSATATAQLHRGCSQLLRGYGCASAAVTSTRVRFGSSSSRDLFLRRTERSFFRHSFTTPRKMSTSTSVLAATAGVGVPFGKYQIPEITSSLEPTTGVCTMTINRPDKANAFNLPMYQNLGDLVQEANSDPTVKVVALTANGKFFSAGNDLCIWEGEDGRRNHDTSVIRDLIAALIDFRKPIVALVNGPAIGIGATMLAHCDAVYATKSAYFLTPFTTLGICAEACSSYLFPKMMGSTRATEMLMFNAKVSADEASSLGLVTRVFADGVFAEETAKLVQATAALPTKSLLVSKELIRGPERAKLHTINRIEFGRVAELVAGDECKEAVQTFLDAKARSKK